jgi:LPXTG-site transpeptidase (sortase) family protein
VLLIVVTNALALAHDPASIAEIPSRVTIPSINLDSAVIPVGVKPLIINGQTYGTWEVAENEVGWHNLSATLGHTGNTVLAGHSNAKARIFQNLRYISLGDEIIVHSGLAEQAHRYVVTEKFLVQEVGVPLETRIKNAQLIAPTHDERLTLVTCARPGATHRLIVVARPVSTDQ